LIAGLLGGNFGHLAGFAHFAAANGTIAQLILQHGIIAGASTPKLIARNDMAQVNHNEGDDE
jgi:hypothetical protein